MPRNPANERVQQPLDSAVECPRCGSADVDGVAFDFDAEVRHDGKLHAFTVRDLKALLCGNCKERIFTDDADRQINDALRLHLGLLSPREMREGIDHLGMSQKEVAYCLNIAEATLSRWLNGVQIQSKSLDTLLRLFLHSADVRATLCGGAHCGCSA